MKVAAVDLPYLWHPVIKGRRYAYYRRAGQLTKLPAVDTPAFLAAYQAAHEAAEAAARCQAVAPPGVVSGSMAALVLAYRSSPEWRELAPATRVDYDKALRPLAERYGRLPIRTMPRQFVFKLRDDYASMPALTRGKDPKPILDEQGRQVIVQTPRRATAW